MSSDPYSTLNVPKDASKEQIRGAFVRVARSIHPDKAGSAPGANEMYSQVDEAWKVLSDPQMKDAYDTFGEVGPQALQVMRQEMDSKRISKQRLEQQISLVQSMQQEDELQTTSSVVCSLRMEDLLAVFSNDPLAHRVPAVLEHVLLDQTTLFQLTPNDLLMFQAAAGTARRHTRPFLGSFTMGLIMQRGLNSFTTQFTLNALSAQKDKRGLGKQVLPRMTLKGMRQITEKVQLGVEFHGDFNSTAENPLEPGLQVFCQRRFTRFTETNVFWGIGSSEGLGVRIRHFQPKVFPNRVGAPQLPKEKRTLKRQYDWKLDLNAIEGNPAMQVSWVEPLAPRARVKTSFTASASTVAIEVERSKVFSDRTKLSGSVGVAFPEGIRFTFKLHRPGGVRYEFPVFITSNITMWNALLTGLVPFALSTLVQRLMLPYRRALRVARRQTLVGECKNWRTKAKNQMRLMMSTAEANKRNASGLEILSAWYGTSPESAAAAASAGADTWDDESSTAGDGSALVVLPANIEVTTQLNFFIAKQTSTLDLGPGTKSQLLGFYDPSIVRGEDGVWAYDVDSAMDDFNEDQGSNAENLLYVKYKYQDHTYEVTFNDEEAVHLPSNQAVRLS